MKNIFLRRSYLVMLLCASIIFNSCKKSPSSANITGKWNMIRLYDKSNATNPSSQFRTGSYIDISSNSMYAYYAEGTDPFESVTITYSRDNDKLNIAADEYWKITKVTSSDLIFDCYDVNTTSGASTYYGTLDLKK